MQVLEDVANKKLKLLDQSQYLEESELLFSHPHTIIYFIIKYTPKLSTPCTEQEENV